VSSKTKQQQKKEDEQTFDTSKFLSLGILFDLTKERNKVQLEQPDKLDTKAVTVLTTATAMVSAALILQAVLPPLSGRSLANKLFEELPLMLLLISYFTAMAGGLIDLMIHPYKLTPDPVRLYEEYLEKEESYTRAKVFKSMIDDYRANEKTIKNQIYWVKYAIVAVWIETVSFVLFLIFHAIR
jgi:hypothetical protein